MRRLSGNALKWIAAVFMVCDHVGVILFPELKILRILGRISFPIFAFMIAEGCRYTRNKLRYFLSIFGVGAVCQLVLFLYNGSEEMNVLLTFSLSVLLVFSFARFKEQILGQNTSAFYPFAYFLAFLGVLAGVLALDASFDLDYGAVGCLVPLFASLLHPPRGVGQTALERVDHPFVHVLATGVGVLLLAFDDGGLQYFGLLALPLLLLYSGKRGRARMKYFFYVFYPLHLLVIWGIKCLFF